MNAGRFETQKELTFKHAAARRVVVWLPPNYDLGAFKNTRHPVLYMHDGQNLFDPATATQGQPWAVDKKIAALSLANKINPPIVVGIDNTALRSREYGPAAAFSKLSEAAIAAGNFNEAPLLSDGYLNFIVHELKPLIDLRYRTNSNAANTVIMGASMGGVISLYGLVRFPDIFGAAGCMSTHWPCSTMPELMRLPVPAAGFEITNSFINWVEENLPKAGRHKLYFDHGTVNLEALYPPHQCRIDGIVRAKGYRSNCDWITQIELGADHDETAWRGRVDVPLQLFFKP